MNFYLEKKYSKYVLTLNDSGDINTEVSLTTRELEELRDLLLEWVPLEDEE